MKSLSEIIHILLSRSKVELRHKFYLNEEIVTVLKWNETSLSEINLM